MYFKLVLTFGDLYKSTIAYEFFRISNLNINYQEGEYPGADFLKDTSIICNLIFCYSKITTMQEWLTCRDLQFFNDTTRILKPWDRLRGGCLRGRRRDAAGLAAARALREHLALVE